MRVILYTGKGGVGKTSLAATTAVVSAASGKRTIVVSTDTAHSLGDSFDLELNDEPVKIRENLWAQEISTLFSAEKSWGKVEEYLSALLISQNIKDITAEELIVFPGLEELFSLLEILNHCKEGKYDVVEKGDISLSLKGDELTIRVGDYKRNIFLPRKLLDET